MVAAIDLYPIILYVILLVVIAVWTKRKESAEGFLIADRKVSWLFIAGTLFALIGGGEIVLITSLAYSFGLSVIWFGVGIAIGFALLAIVGKKIKAIADKNKFYTLPDYFHTTFDAKTGFLSTIILFIAHYALLIVQFIVGGLLIAALTGLEYAVTVLIVGVIVLFYVALGGFKANVKTDFLQLVFMFIIFVLLSTIDVGAITPPQLDLFTLGAFSMASFIIIGVLIVLGAADVWQIVYSSKSVKDVRKGVLVAAVLAIAFGSAFAFWGIDAHNRFPGIAPDDALFLSFAALPAGLLGLGIVVIFASIMSTIDSEIFITSMNFSRDFLSHVKNLRTRESLVQITRYFIFILSVLSFLFAIVLKDVVTTYFALVSLILVISPALLASLYFRIKSNAAFLSLLSGFVTFLGMLVLGIYTPENSIVVLPISLVFLFVGQKVFRA